MKFAISTLAAAALGTAALAQETGFESGNTVLWLGKSDLDSGQSDREFIGVQGNYFRADGLGLHFDLAGLSSDQEDTAYGAFALSTEVAPNLRAKLGLGGSDSEDGFFPEYKIDGELEKDFGTQNGLVLRGGLTYSRYDNDAEEARLRAQIVRYTSPLSNGGYFVQQGDVSVSTSLDSDTTGWEIGAGATYVDASGWSAGLGLGVGRIAYDQQLGATVENDFWAVRPSVSYRVGSGTELFLRTEYVDTELYDLKAATFGVNFDLN